MLANELTLNMDKTEYMIAGSRQRTNKIENDPHIRLGNDNIKRVKETKTLGIIIDDDDDDDAELSMLFRSLASH